MRLRGLKRRSAALAVSMTPKKFCLFMLFGAFATHLIYLGELSQLKYTAVRNKSLHYSQFVEHYLHRNQSDIKNHTTRLMSVHQLHHRLRPPRSIQQSANETTKVLLVASNPRSGSSFIGELLTAMPNVSYFFEPLWFLSRPNKSHEAPLRKVRDL